MKFLQQENSTFIWTHLIVPLKLRPCSRFNEISPCKAWRLRTLHFLFHDRPETRLWRHKDRQGEPGQLHSRHLHAHQPRPHHRIYHRWSRVHTAEHSWGENGITLTKPKLKFFIFSQFGVSLGVWCISAVLQCVSSPGRGRASWWAAAAPAWPRGSTAGTSWPHKYVQSVSERRLGVRLVVVFRSRFVKPSWQECDGRDDDGRAVCPARLHLPGGHRGGLPQQEEDSRAGAGLTAATVNGCSWTRQEDWTAICNAGTMYYLGYQPSREAWSHFTLNVHIYK